MSEPKQKKFHRGEARHANPVHPGMEDKTQTFIKTYVDAMKEVFPPRTEAPMPWNPKLPVYSVSAIINPLTETESLIVNLTNVSAAAADKGAEFCRFMALELHPSEKLAIVIERHKDIPMNLDNPVFMPPIPR